MTASVRHFLAVISLASLAACSWFSADGEKVAWDGAVLSAASDMNDNSALAVDLVVVRDSALAAQLAATSATQWFETRQDLAASFGPRLAVKSWELVPGAQIVVAAKELPGGRSEAVYLFSRYVQPGAHRVLVTSLQGTLRVSLGRQRASVLVGP